MELGRWKGKRLLLALILFVEYAENGSLFGFLQQSKVDLGRDIKWAMEIAQGENDFDIV